VRKIRYPITGVTPEWVREGGGGGGGEGGGERGGRRGGEGERKGGGGGGGRGGGGGDGYGGRGGGGGGEGGRGGGGGGGGGGGERGVGGRCREAVCPLPSWFGNERGETENRGPCYNFSPGKGVSKKENSFFRQPLHNTLSEESGKRTRPAEKGLLQAKRRGKQLLKCRSFQENFWQEARRRKVSDLLGNTRPDSRLGRQNEVETRVPTERSPSALGKVENETTGKDFERPGNAGGAHAE